MLTGTNYFDTYTDALFYYRPYGFDNLKESVLLKIESGEINIGRPKTKQNEKLIFNSDEGRYFIETV